MKLWPLFSQPAARPFDGAGIALPLTRGIDVIAVV
jgi:hypothetical protein